MKPRGGHAAKCQQPSAELRQSGRWNQLPGGGDHQRGQVVAAPPHEQGRQQIYHHDHDVHGDALEIGIRGDEIEETGTS